MNSSELAAFILIFCGFIAALIGLLLLKVEIDGAYERIILLEGFRKESQERARAQDIRIDHISTTTADLRRWK